MSDAFEVVHRFERRMCSYTGSPFAVAVDSCTSAIALACNFHGVEVVDLPKRTYCSVPNAVIQAGGRIRWVERAWSGAYTLDPYPIVDSARRLYKDMYVSGTHMCLSFHPKKHLNLSKGGMILTDDPEAQNWYRAMRFDGRHADIPIHKDKLMGIGHHCLMTPDIAAQGLYQMMYMPDTNEDLQDVDPDLSLQEVYKSYAVE